MARTRFLFLKRHICQVCNRSQVMQEDNILPGVSLKQDGWLVACVTALILQIWSTTEGPSLENTWADLGFGLVVGGNFFQRWYFFSLFVQIKTPKTFWCCWKCVKSTGGDITLSVKLCWSAMHWMVQMVNIYIYFGNTKLSRAVDRNRHVLTLDITQSRLRSRGVATSETVNRWKRKGMQHWQSPLCGAAVAL